MMVSFASATLLINKPINDLYNLGDTINIPVKITTAQYTSDFLIMTLFCDGQSKEIQWGVRQLNVGEELEETLSLPLREKFISRMDGTCQIKISFSNEYVQTKEFTISSSIIVEPKAEKLMFFPGEELTIEGKASKENSAQVHGFIEINMTNKATGENLDILDTVNLGYFSVSFPVPDDMKAGVYPINLYVYEKDADEEITNHGNAEYEIEIGQVATNLEILFENPNVEPGTSMKVKAILHDQTGEPISSTAIITIKNKVNTILEQTEKPTNEFLEFPILYKEPPSNWTVVAVSNKITSEANFEIIEKEQVKVDIINKTIIITNTGNVFYNKSVQINIGNESINIDVSLKIDESQKYVLSAPDGEYQVKILADGEDKLEQSVMLTGKVISVKEASGAVLTLVRYPFVWIFIIGIMGFVAFLVYKKGYKRSFFGYIPQYFKKKDKTIPSQQTKESLINSKNKAELSLSIKGDKQNISLICLKIKNFKEIKSQKGNAQETIQSIVNLAEGRKSTTYDNQENLFFIFAPIKTRTFNNEKNALETIQMIKEALDKHNKLFKQKIDFGISLDYGTIIANQDKDSLKFMSMGTLVTNAKKIATLSNGEIFLGENIKSRISTLAKTEKHSDSDGKNIYFTIKEMKKTDEHKKFLDNFLEGLDRDKKKGK